MKSDIELRDNRILIPQKFIDKLKWKQNDKLRLWIEDDFLIIGKIQSVNEVVDSIKSFREREKTKMQSKRPLRDKMIDVTLKELLEVVDLLEKRVKKLEKG